MVSNICFCRLNAICVGIQSSKSATNLDMQFKTQLDQLHKNLDMKAKKTGISKYLDNGNDDDSDDESFEDQKDDDIFDGEGDKSMMAEKDPSKLIDLELVNLLRFCNDLKKKHKETEDYQDEVMTKSTELGKKNKDKLLILDMDETMIAAKFDGQEPKNFVPNYTFPFGDTKIHVRFRPYLNEILEKLALTWEIVVWTAGVQDYADPILDQIDPDKTLFKKRMYRTSCIKADQFFIKDLDVILDRQKENMVLVDNSILSFAFDLANGVPINSFMGNEKDDKDLLYLVGFLEEAFYHNDLRKACEESFKLLYLLSTITGEPMQE